MPAETARPKSLYTGKRYPIHPLLARARALKDCHGQKIETILERAAEIGLAALEANPTLLIRSTKEAL